ncbi:MAG: hypothetical protein ACE5PV_18225 [Candidatus Poribacteria bacterium]
MTNWKRVKTYLPLLMRLKRGVNRANKKALLLVDEAESLIDVGKADKAFLGRLRTMMQDATFVRTILCGARHLSEVNQINLGGPRFLDGFEPVLFVSSLTDTDADALIAQSQTGQGLQVSSEIATEIKEKTNRHPYLIQSICAYLYDHQMDLKKACDYVMKQGMAEKAFADDYRYLAPVEKQILIFIYQVALNPDLIGAKNVTFRQIQGQVGLDTDSLNRLLVTLDACGYIKKSDSGYRMANEFFTRWLMRNETRLREMPSVVSDAAILSFKFE